MNSLVKSKRFLSVLYDQPKPLTTEYFEIIQWDQNRRPGHSLDEIFAEAAARGGDTSNHYVLDLRSENATLNGRIDSTTSQAIIDRAATWGLPMERGYYYIFPRLEPNRIETSSTIARDRR